MLVFPSTLVGPARQWFKQYKKHSISSWKSFSADFKRAFWASQAAQIKADSLENVKQQPGEPLKTYLSRFANIVARARDADESSRLMAMRTGILVGGDLWKEI